MAKQPPMVPVGARSAAVWAALLLASLPAAAFGECPGIHVTILNIRNSTGTVACALFESPEGFPIEVPALGDERHGDKGPQDASALHL